MAHTLVVLTPGTRAWILVVALLVFCSGGPHPVTAQESTGAQRLAILVEHATANPPLYGPEAGELHFDRDSEAYDFLEMAPLHLTNLAVHVEVQNPFAATDGAWLHRVGFRIGAEPHFRFQIHSDGTWILKDHATTYASGAVLGLAAGDGDWNTIDLVAVGGIGYVAINDVFLAELPLNASVEPGRISVGGASDEPDAISHYRAFSIWTLGTESGSSPLQLSETGYVEADAAVFANAIAGVANTEPDFGPESGKLEVENAQVLPLRQASVNTRDFVFHCTFEIPYDGDEHLWDVGVQFRVGGGTAIRFRVESSHYWYLTYGSSDPFQMGYLDGLPTDEGDALVLELVAIGAKGYVSINGTYIVTLDLSSNGGVGALMIGTAFDFDATVVGTVVPYSEFTVWSLDQED